METWNWHNPRSSKLFLSIYGYIQFLHEKRFLYIISWFASWPWHGASSHISFFSPSGGIDFWVQANLRACPRARFLLPPTSSSNSTQPLPQANADPHVILSHPSSSPTRLWGKQFEPTKHFPLSRYSLFLSSSFLLAFLSLCFSTVLTMP